MTKRLTKIFLTFDCFGTLYTPKPSVAKQYADYVTQHANVGTISTELVKQRFKEGFSMMAKTVPNYGITKPAVPMFIELPHNEQERELEVAKKWWLQVIRYTFKDYCRTDNTTNNDNTKPQIPDEVFDGLYEHFGDKKAYSMYGDVLPLLSSLVALQSELKAKNYELSWGILTNSDPRIFAILKSLGILDKLGDPRHMFLSYDMGIQKPDPGVFEFVMRQVQGNSQVNGDASKPAAEFHYFHIGDELVNDQQAASAVPGWNGVLIDRTLEKSNIINEESSGSSEKEKEALDSKQGDNQKRFTISNLCQIPKLLKNYLSEIEK